MNESNIPEIKKSWDRIATLEKRLRWLDNRIKYAESDGKEFSFDKAEASALRWAIPILIQLRDTAVNEYKKGDNGDTTRLKDLED